MVTAPPVNRPGPAGGWMDRRASRIGDFARLMLPAYTEVGAARQNEYPVGTMRL